MNEEKEKLHLEADKQTIKDDSKPKKIKRGKSLEGDENESNTDENKPKRSKAKNIEVTNNPGEPDKMETDHHVHGEGNQEYDDVIGGENMKKHIIKMGEKCDSYQSIIKGLVEKKTKEDIEGLGKSHITYKYRTVWEFFGLTSSEKLVTYKKKRILTPRGARKDVIRMAHDKHGVQRMSSRIKKNFYWPQLDEDVRSIMQSCSECREWGEID